MVEPCATFSAYPLVILQGIIGLNTLTIVWAATEKDISIQDISFTMWPRMASVKLQHNLKKINVI